MYTFYQDAGVALLVLNPPPPAWTKYAKDCSLFDFK
jgi:hypothetical protein